MGQTRQIDESLSALMDGEAQDLELRRILKESADKESSVRDDWSRLHVAQSALHGNDDALAFSDWDISGAVSAAIADEPAHKSGSKPAASVPNWMKPLASVAIAAGVAAVVVFGFGEGVVLPGQSDGGTQVAASADPATEGSRAYPAFSKPASGGVTVGATPLVAPRYEGERNPNDRVVSQDAIERFNLFLQKHTERAALNNGQGVMSYARAEQSVQPAQEAQPAVEQEKAEQ